MKIAVTEVINAPSGATHYTGWLLEEDGHTFYKQRQVASYPVWFWWDTHRREWMLYGDIPPSWLEPINNPPHSQVIQ